MTLRVGSGQLKTSRRRRPMNLAYFARHRQNPRRAYSELWDLGALCFDSSQIFTKYRSHPHTNPGAPSVCRIVVAMMGKLHLQVIRDICIRLYIEEQIGRSPIKSPARSGAHSRRKNPRAILM